MSARVLRSIACVQESVCRASLAKSAKARAWDCETSLIFLWEGGGGCCGAFETVHIKASVHRFVPTSISAQQLAEITAQAPLAIATLILQHAVCYTFQ